MRILVVEDERKVASFVRQGLEEEGYAVDVAPDGAMAVDLALGGPAYDRLLWNGSYYVQRLEAGDSTTDQYGDGCLADQLLGQWWAHELGLGYLLPAERVREALRSIVRNNLHARLGEFQHRARVFGDAGEAGLLLCTWPGGGRPEAPVDYCDEVWTGIEYQVAAHCLREGLADEAQAVLGALHGRYTGVRRNPFNHIECGDHYVRALAGWSVLRALGGIAYDAADGTLRLHVATPPGEFRGPYVAGQSFGRLHRQSEGALVRVRLTCCGGELAVRRIELPGETREVSFALRAGDQLAVEYEPASGPSYTVGHIPMRIHAPGDHDESG